MQVIFLNTYLLQKFKFSEDSCWTCIAATSQRTWTTKHSWPRTTHHRLGSVCHQQCQVLCSGRHVNCLKHGINWQRHALTFLAMLVQNLAKKMWSLEWTKTPNEHIILWQWPQPIIYVFGFHPFQYQPMEGHIALWLQRVFRCHGCKYPNTTRCPFVVVHRSPSVLWDTTGAPQKLWDLNKRGAYLQVVSAVCMSCLATLVWNLPFRLISASRFDI